MAIGIHVTSGFKVALFSMRLPYKASPFVSQSQLLERMKKDRFQVARELQSTRRLMRYPHQGIPTSRSTVHDWETFLSWIDDAIKHLEQPRSIPELEILIRSWQASRMKVLPPSLGWHRRADAIAV